MCFSHIRVKYTGQHWQLGVYLAVMVQYCGAFFAALCCEKNSSVCFCRMNFWTLAGSLPDKHIALIAQDLVQAVSRCGAAKVLTTKPLLNGNEIAAASPLKSSEIGEFLEVLLLWQLRGSQKTKEGALAFMAEYCSLINVGKDSWHSATIGWGQLRHRLKDRSGRYSMSCEFDV